MPENLQLQRAWKISQKNIDCTRISEDSVEKSVKFCLRVAKNCEDEQNSDEAEGLYMHALSVDGSNSGINVNTANATDISL